MVSRCLLSAVVVLSFRHALSFGHILKSIGHVLVGWDI